MMKKIKKRKYKLYNKIFIKKQFLLSIINNKAKSNKTKKLQLIKNKKKTTKLNNKVLRIIL